MNRQTIIDALRYISRACRNAPPADELTLRVWERKLRHLSDEDGCDAIDALTDDDSWTPYPADVLRKAHEQAAQRQAHQVAQRAIYRAAHPCTECDGYGWTHGTREIGGRSYDWSARCPNHCPAASSTAGDVMYATRATGGMTTLGAALGKVRRPAITASATGTGRP